MSKQSKRKNTLWTILKYILVVLLLIGVVGLVINFVSCDEDISGMYITYGDSVITSDNDGITVSFSETETAVFTIENTEGWGVNDVTSCTVKVINNVSASSGHDFEFVVDGANLPSNFSDITDFTSVFATNGKIITVNSDGTFELSFKYQTVTDVLQAYYGKEIVIDSELRLGSYTYFAIQVTSPDESETIIIPFTYNFTPVAVEWVELSDSNIYF